MLNLRSTKKKLRGPSEETNVTSFLLLSPSLVAHTIVLYGTVSEHSETVISLSRSPQSPYKWRGKVFNGNKIC